MIFNLYKKFSFDANGEEYGVTYCFTNGIGEADKPPATIQLEYKVTKNGIESMAHQEQIPAKTLYLSNEQIEKIIREKLMVETEVIWPTMEGHFTSEIFFHEIGKPGKF